MIDHPRIPLAGVIGSPVAHSKSPRLHTHWLRSLGIRGHYIPMDVSQANLREVANDQSGETLRKAGRLSADLQFGRIDEILATGLHAYLTQFLDRVNDLGAGIGRDFLVPVAA